MFTKNIQNRLWIAPVLCVFTQGVSAQFVEEFQGAHVRAPWPSEVGSSGSFGRSVCARLSPDGQADAVVLDGAQPVVFFDVDAHLSPVDVPLAAHDIACLRGAGEAGADALVLLTTSGVTRATYDAATSGFAFTTIAGAGWGNAKLARASDLNGDGLDDLVVLASDAHTIQTLVASGSAADLEPGAEFESSWPVLDVVPLQWNEDASLEFAVLSNYGLEVLDGDGAVLASWPSVLPGGVIARVRQAGQATDRVAWITKHAPPAQQWLRVEGSVVGASEVVDLGALDAFAMEGLDYDMDGDDDLLIAHHQTNELIWFENERSSAAPLATSFPVADPTLKLFRVGPPGGGAQLNEANPVVGDFDSDGDLDLFYAAETSHTVELLRGETLDELQYQVDITGAEWLPPTSGSFGQLVLDLELPAVLPVGASSVTVDIYQGSAVGSMMQVEGIDHEELPLSGAWPAQVSLALPETTSDWSTLYVVEVHVSAGSGAGLVQSPPLLAAFTLDATSLAQLAQDSYTLGSPIEVVVHPQGPGPETQCMAFRRSTSGHFPGKPKPKGV